MIKITVVLEKSTDGGYTVHVPTLPGCFSEGETVEEAIANIREAIELHLETIEDDLIVEEGGVTKELIWYDSPEATREPARRGSEVETPEIPVSPRSSTGFTRKRRIMKD